MKHLLGNSSGDNPGTTWRRDHTDGNGATLSGDLTGHCMGLPNLVPPVTPPHRDDRQLSQNDSTTNGGGDFLAALDAKSNVAVTVTDDDEGLETGTLTGTGLLLNGHDFHDLVLEGRAEVVDDLVLLDWEGMEVDLLQRLNLVGFDETSKLRDWDPLLLLLLATGHAPSTVSPVSLGCPPPKPLSKPPRSPPPRSAMISFGNERE